MRAVRALSGAVAAGVVVLAFVVVGAAVLGGREGFPGPGTVSLATHVAGAAVALIAQSWADRRFGIRALPGSLVVFVVLAALLWTQWWG
ncbi:hypothetical protein DW322_18075 [Rhodococcus rhodnii]|uniref:Uncharacterized protein n=1 Tax=Rhodococcus rhodnii TaxID=38312 RepID=A0A6P2CJM9_9NOCA|nr:hypothetical protein DW322_18075 [Rhodococcus rhodnii]